MTVTAARFSAGDLEYRKELLRKKKQARRQKEVHRHILLIILGLILAAGLALSYHAIRSNANTDLEDVRYKYYTSVSVKYGETLWSLAETYGKSQYESPEAYIKEVMYINHLKNDEIAAGQYLVIPYYSSEFIGATAARE